MRKVLFCFGTRPEAIKLAPVIKHFLQDDFFKTLVCSTSQHKAMLQSVLNTFELVPDFDMDLMTPNQTLFDLTATCISKFKNILIEHKPDWIVVQGDTTTAFCAALAGFYAKVQVCHIEAGLRSDNKYSPYPEEINRKLISQLADLHMAPTSVAANNLASEGFKKNIFITGNTVVDALMQLKGKVQFPKEVTSEKKIILITGHRRESFGEGFKEICKAILLLAERFTDFHFVYPVHLNPEVQKPVYQFLAGKNNIQLLAPLPYLQMLALMQKSYLILSDSGGVQEEAPTFNVPVLVMRDVTERTEGILANVARLVGTKCESIVENTSLLIQNKDLYTAMQQAGNPYGDGNASAKILDILKLQYRIQEVLQQ